LTGAGTKGRDVAVIGVIIAVPLKSLAGAVFKPQLQLQPLELLLLFLWSLSLLFLRLLERQLIVSVDLTSIKNSRQLFNITIQDHRLHAGTLIHDDALLTRPEFARFVLYMHAARAAQPGNNIPCMLLLLTRTLFEARIMPCLVVYHFFNTWLRKVIIQTSVSGMDLVSKHFSPSAAHSHGAKVEISWKLMLQYWMDSLPAELRSPS
jgi:hypothetical protein